LDLAARKAVLLLFDDGHLPGWDRSAVAALCADVPDLEVVRLLMGTLEAGTGDYRDASGTLFRQWRARGGDAALVRPDGHVGWREARPTPLALRAGVRRALGLTTESGLRVAFAPSRAGTPHLW
jgi:hypothetical protein